MPVRSILLQPALGLLRSRRSDSHLAGQPHHCPCIPPASVIDTPAFRGRVPSMTVIGVDFGTTNSVVTLLRPDGTVATMRHAFGTAELDVIRSVLCFWNDGTKN